MHNKRVKHDCQESTETANGPRSKSVSFLTSRQTREKEKKNRHENDTWNVNDKVKRHNTCIYTTHIKGPMHSVWKHRFSSIIIIAPSFLLFLWSSRAHPRCSFKVFEWYVYMDTTLPSLSVYLFEYHFHFELWICLKTPRNFIARICFIFGYFATVCGERKRSHGSPHIQGRCFFFVGYRFWIRHTDQFFFRRKLNFIIKL